MRAIVLSILLMSGTVLAEEAAPGTDAAPSPQVPQAPWRTDVAAAREEALKTGKPCVLVVNVDSFAL